MTANELFQAGKLAEATAAQIAKVKANPGDDRARLFLFELFLFAGDLDRAKKQLEALRFDKQEQMAAIAHYHQTLDAEAARRAVFAGTAEPAFLAPPPDHVQHRLAALKAAAKGDTSATQELLAQAAAATPAFNGSVNDGPPAAITDADDRLGPVLEVFGSGGTYAWVPLETVSALTMNPPSSPRHILWRPARLVTTTGMNGEVIIPGLYPNTHLAVDEELKCGRATDWADGNGLAIPAGGRLLQSGETTWPFAHVNSVLGG